jgi:hypothetical protein
MCPDSDEWCAVPEYGSWIGATVSWTSENADLRKALLVQSGSSQAGAGLPRIHAVCLLENRGLHADARMGGIKRHLRWPVNHESGPLCISSAHLQFGCFSSELAHREATAGTGGAVACSLSESNYLLPGALVWRSI